ncbi:acyltransferase family protein [Neobacillus sp. M.A.Huq-85]
MTENIKNRLEYLDIAKGILIILVVLGHSPYANRYVIYWFHMPAFFIISGLLYKKGRPVSLFQNIKSLFIPYVSFSLINIASILWVSPIYNGLEGFKILVEKHLYSGKVLGGVFWFIPVFFLTKIIFSFLSNRLNNKYLGLTIAILYTIAHLLSIYFIPNNNHTRTPENMVFPWNIDVVPIALSYYFIGFYIQRFTYIFHNCKNVLLFALFCVFFLIINKLYGLNYQFDMKYSFYKNLMLDMFVPFIFTILILFISRIISKVSKEVPKVLSKLGENSLFIMYLHIPVCSVLLANIRPEYTLYTLIGISVPMCFAILVQKNKYINFLFTGKIFSYENHQLESKTK